ncbi:putative NSF attachment protein [Helianthus annuus]|uniref:NSF attachment protein n=1 Tax=Helianthus annuus TaxID=4232 RepID=A0A251UK92_HELAN|nr:putative NSF attachment protein [Helianthus annuus]KAJ0560165.1 putative NSF attachment protein [Helianthus annuus]KAJ0566402.1 putative NSF attachment protein [Helianthus annuus]KAJ0573162.1 putative NSF attachment protein [Helianthus annuus]KAJ0737582.1 putative NSF attachment protein [Helianthus annuus]
MSDQNQIKKGEDFEKQAEKKLKGWAFFGSKHEDAADLYEKAANFYKLGKSWDQAGAVYVKLAECFLKLDSKHEAANAFADAGHCYKKTNPTECITRLEQSLDLFMEIGRLGMSARYCKEIAELYEQEQNLEKAMVYYDKAVDLYQGEEVNSSANQCRLKIAQYAAELEQYQKAIEIYEDIAKQALNNNLLKYGVRGHLLNAGICQLCKGDVVAITNALEKYEDLDPTFSGSREYKLLSALAASIDEEDVEKFTDAIKEFDSITKLDAWKTTLLLRVKEMLKAKEMEDDDLT